MNNSGCDLNTLLNHLVNKHYKYLLTVAKRITRRKDVELAADLISETYLSIIENEKQVPEDDTGFIMYFVRYMKLQFLGERSTFNKAMKLQADIEHGEIQLGEWDEVFAEPTNEATKELLKELSHLKETQVSKLINVYEIKESLPGHLKTIFELHFENGLSSREIAEMMEKETGYKMYYGRYNDMINEVKTYLK